ncbi:NAD(P)H-dependent oxidoreductase [Anaerostipes sp.]|nr:NAD(P)H-dependent oxidoreductase [Anaerostipes sp.]
MKVLLINGSPHENGCTYTALAEVADILEKNDLHTQT